ncbi:hypothetical protein GCM10027162_00800 [Streptomyces incanus]
MPSLTRLGAATGNGPHGASAHGATGIRGARLTALFADHGPEEIAVLSDWSTRANALTAGYLEEHGRTK